MSSVVDREMRERGEKLRAGLYRGLGVNVIIAG